jgi:hypothetical protein
LTPAVIGATVARYREAGMKTSRFVAALALVCGLGASQLFAQGAAESVLTHSLSSGAGSTLGKTLGNAVGNAAGQLGGKLGQQTSTAPSVQRVPAAKAKATSVAPAATTSAPSSSGSLIASIQGEATSPLAGCAVAPNATQADSSHSKPTSAAAQVAGTPVPVTVAPAPVPVTNCRTAPGTDSHPAVVNLPAPK